jgi:DNA-binding transcriptional ArsR family regulator
MANRPEPDLAGVADLVGDRARGAMLVALLGGEWLPAGELATRAGVARSTASEHLARLVEHGLVKRRASGRHRYFALAGPDVAVALEALARLAPAVPPGRAQAAYSEMRALRFARTCYDHLAGALGVMLADTLAERGLVAPDYVEVTGAGWEWLEGLGVDVHALRRGRRTLVRPCLDWSERQDHLAGAVGAAITVALLDRRWIVRMAGTRAVRLTARGRDGLHRAVGLDVP